MRRACYRCQAIGLIGPNRRRTSQRRAGDSGNVMAGGSARDPTPPPIVKPANMALQLHINVSLNRPPDRTRRRPSGRPRNKWLDQLRNDSTTLPIGELWRRAVDRGHGGATSRRPSPATRPWWCWWWWYRKTFDVNKCRLGLFNFRGVWRPPPNRMQLLPCRHPSPNFVCMLIHGRGSLLLWWRCDMSCTSGFCGWRKTNKTNKGLIFIYLTKAGYAIRSDLSHRTRKCICILFEQVSASCRL